MDIKTRQENKIIHFSGTIVGSDNGDQGQTDPVEQPDQDPHSQRHQNKARDKICQLFRYSYWFRQWDPGQTDPVEQSDQDPTLMDIKTKQENKNHQLFRYHCWF